MHNYYSSVRTQQVHFFDHKAGECEMSQLTFFLTGWVYQDMGE